jgi:hypothetical protein
VLKGARAQISPVQPPPGLARAVRWGGGRSGCPGVILFPSWHIGTVEELGSTLLEDAVRKLGLRRIEDSAKEGTSPGEGFNPLLAIIPLLTAVSASR